MGRSFILFLILFSAVTIIIADSLIKKISAGQTFSQVISNPWIIVICGLYLLQIFLIILVFIFAGELALYVNLFIIFYGILGIIIGISFFKETITTTQFIGITLGLIGAVLINLK